MHHKSGLHMTSAFGKYYSCPLTGKQNDFPLCRTALLFNGHSINYLIIISLTLITIQASFTFYEKLIVINLEKT